MRETPTRRRAGTPADPEEARDQVLAAARRCFLRFGVQRTTMADVAKEAGLTRTALYRVVPSAGELVELVVVARVAEIATALESVLAQEADFAEAILATVLVAVEGARADPELQNFFATSSTLRIHHLMTGDFPAVSDLVVELFRPRFATARAAGELRTDVSDEQLAEWLRGVMLMLILRDDLDRSEEEATLRAFLLPALNPARAR